MSEHIKDFLTRLERTAKMQRNGYTKIITRMEGDKEIKEKIKIPRANNETQFLMRCRREGVNITYPETFLRVYWNPYRKVNA